MGTSTAVVLSFFPASTATAAGLLVYVNSATAGRRRDVRLMMRLSRAAQRRQYARQRTRVGEVQNRWHDMEPLDCRDNRVAQNAAKNVGTSDPALPRRPSPRTPVHVHAQVPVQVQVRVPVMAVRPRPASVLSETPTSNQTTGPGTSPATGLVDHSAAALMTAAITAGVQGRGAGFVVVGR